VAGRAVLEVVGLEVHFPTPEGLVRAVRNVSFTLREGEVLALVGESGAGKTTTALAILRLLPHPGRVAAGRILYRGRDLLTLPEGEMRRLRGRELAMVFQDPHSALNPVLTVGAQMEEVFRAHTSVDRREARRLALSAMRLAGLPDPEALVDRYPFQLSGGMAQRVVLAMALALSPRVLIADEPTAHLDVTLQAQVLQRLRRVQQEEGSSLLLITHNLGLVAGMADRVAVLYAGTVVEEADTRTLFRRAMHPYTWALLRALPRLDRAEKRLATVPGLPPDPAEASDLCPFLHRCPKAVNLCRLQPRPPLEEREPGHRVACYNPVLPDPA